MSGRETENKILDAALDVVSEKTISGTRVHLVTEQAGIVPSNLHYYFKTKEDLLLELLERILEQYVESRSKILEREYPSLPSALSCFFDQKKDIIKNESHLDYIEMDYWVQSKLDNRIKKQLNRSYSSWRESIREVLEAHLPGLSEKKKKYLSYMMVSMMVGASVQYLLDDSFDLNEYFSMGLTMLLQSAGIDGDKPCSDTPDEDIDEQMES